MNILSCSASNGRSIAAARASACHLICDCPCACTCKHEFAAMLQLRETLALIEAHYLAEHSGYFAAITKSALFSFAVNNKETGCFTLSSAEKN